MKSETRKMIDLDIVRCFAPSILAENMLLAFPMRS
jgi:hypothetical protein